MEEAKLSKVKLQRVFEVYRQTNRSRDPNNLHTYLQ